MKEEIYTIPVMDGLKADSECPFCSMYKTLEDKTIAYVLSPAYMEEDVRGETNALGFCKEHIRRLYLEGNSLGMGLMLHSQLKHQHDELDKLVASLEPSGRSARKLFAKKALSICPAPSLYIQLVTPSVVVTAVSTARAYHFPERLVPVLWS